MILRTGIEYKREGDKTILKIIKDNRILKEIEIGEVGWGWYSAEYLNRVWDNGNLGLVGLKKLQIKQLKQEIKKIKRGENVERDVEHFFAEEQR